MFKNREDAAKQLATLIPKQDLIDPIVIAIPRGGIQTGAVLAKELSIPLDIIITKKIGHPYNPEFAIGSVSLDEVVVSTDTEISQIYIEGEVTKLKKYIKKKYELYQKEKQPLPIKGKTVILTDDGVATGNTIIAAIKTLRKKEPHKIIVAIPVGPPVTIKEIEKLADKVICITKDPFFRAVGEFYEEFPQVSDEQAIEFLHNY